MDKEYVRYLFDYDASEGKLKWKNHLTKSNRNGQYAGSINGKGYYCVTINKKSFRIHRLIWLYHKGFLPDIIDHKDLNKLNNRIENLREATIQQNNANKSGLGSNTGFKGIRWVQSRKKYKVYITHNHVNYYLGLFTNLDEAVEAHRKKNLELNGEFAKF